MTCEEYLALQERQVLRSLTQAAKETGVAVEQAVDLQGHVRRRPALAMGLSALAGFAAAAVVCTSGHRVTRGALRAVWSPLIQPTVGALGSMVARILLGSVEPPRE